MQTKLHRCCFIGHRKINETKALRVSLKNTIKDLIIDKDVDTFLFGSKSEFNTLCHELVTELKIKHPHIQRIYVRAEYQYIDDDYKKYLLEDYEETYFPINIGGSGKAIYIRRNYHMIDNCNFCIAYYDKNYTPSKKRIHQVSHFSSQTQSGTKLAYEYALKTGINIINTFQS